MSKRTLPYGYRYENGVVSVDVQQRSVICEIFSEYLRGQSLQTIAKKLNANRTEYRPGVIGWNKSRMMSLINDARYVGNETYPALISAETHTQAMLLKQKKNTQQNTNREDAIYKLLVPMYCPKCGKVMHRKRHHVGNEWWKCGDTMCRAGFPLPDQILLSALTDRLNQVINNPDIIREEITAHEISMDLKKLKNEISHTLERTTYDKEVLRKKMTEYTYRRYAEIDTTPYIARKMKVDFERSGLLSDFSIALFQKTVQSMYISENGTVGITLLNGQRIGGDEDHD